MIILCVRNRAETTLILIPAFFLCSTTCAILRVLTDQTPYFDYFEALDYFCYFMGHWMFAVHYLRTSLILPKLLKEAKLEWLMKDAQKTSAGLQGWDL